MPRSGPRAGRLLIAAGLALVASQASSQTPDLRNDVRVLEMRVPMSAPRYGKGPIAPLPAPILEQVKRGEALLASGALDPAKETLSQALAQAPHHPVILVQLARVHEARRAWRALEQLARAERAHARDSLLLAHELVQSLRRQAKARDAAQVVLEAWIAAPVHHDWARTQLDSIAPVDPRGVRELMRRAAAAQPSRPDLVRGAARIEWQLSDAVSALKLLAGAESHDQGMSVRWAFAEDLIRAASARDSAGAIEVLLDLASDRSLDLQYRLAAVRRAWGLYQRRGAMREGAPRVARAIRDLPPQRWGNPFLIEVMRGLRDGGQTGEARELLKALGQDGQALPEVALERILNDLRDGPPERVLEAFRARASDSPGAAFLYAEALFFSGHSDSARAWYERAAHDPAGTQAGAALERLYLIEDEKHPVVLSAFGRLAYEQWRGETRKALALADSLYRSLERGPLWAQAALALASLREATEDGKAALEPLLAVVEALPEDRAAPLACQRAGDVLRVWHKDEARALQQYEECLARYPKAWNAPEVRRTAEMLRRERRF